MPGGKGDTGWPGAASQNLVANYYFYVCVFPEIQEGKLSLGVGNSRATCALNKPTTVVCEQNNNIGLRISSGPPDTYPLCVCVCVREPRKPGQRFSICPMHTRFDSPPSQVQCTCSCTYQ